jgi:PIN domain nuclease of toxin-antitoxin system
MKYLLDTHALVWMLVEPEELSTNTRAAIQSPENTIFYSAVSIWEIATKHRLKRKTAPPLSGRDAIHLAMQSGCESITLLPEHAIMIDTMPMYHHDPFDRMLIAQAQFERLILITRDSEFNQYDVELLKA